MASQVIAGQRPDLTSKLQARYADRAQTAEVTFIDEASGEAIDTAHRFVLELHSSVLQAMLVAHAVEAQTRSVTILEAFVDAVPKAVEWMYGLPIEIATFDAAANLLEFAEYYEIPDLYSTAVQTVRGFIGDPPSEAELGSMLRRFHFDAKMTETALEAVAKHAETFLFHTEWLGLSRDLVLQILRRDDIICDERRIFEAVVAWTHANPQYASEDRGIAREILEEIRLENMTKEDLFGIKASLPLEVYMAALERVLNITPCIGRRPTRSSSSVPSAKKPAAKRRKRRHGKRPADRECECDRCVRQQ
eukprot:TRINITY_DN50601_c0_g2_i1.p1 TRINITY_DN50601_c0_g2~~TRINITY_DN50601_c0_g2_i1.p1  ORF type:complete len:306 (-),score=36.77 TRINITY_DN50601_c0_g2_i1:89-1006(-)